MEVANLFFVYNLLRTDPYRFLAPIEWHFAVGMFRADPGWDSMSPCGGVSRAAFTTPLIFRLNWLDWVWVEKM